MAAAVELLQGLRASSALTLMAIETRITRYSTWIRVPVNSRYFADCRLT